MPIHKICYFDTSRILYLADGARELKMFRKMGHGEWCHNKSAGWPLVSVATECRKHLFFVWFVTIAKYPFADGTRPSGVMYYRAQV